VTLVNSEQRPELPRVRAGPRLAGVNEARPLLTPPSMFMPKPMIRILLLLAGIIFSTDPAFAAATRPNLLLILSDDHSAAHVGCYGGPNVQTPRLDAFAAEGMRFTRAYTSAPQCAPSTVRRYSDGAGLTSGKVTLQ
jgi:hypothetical protein